MQNMEKKYIFFGLNFENQAHQSEKGVANGHNNGMVCGSAALVGVPQERQQSAHLHGNGPRD